MAKAKPAKTSKAVPKAPAKGRTKVKTPAPVNPKVEANPFAQEPAPSWLEAIHEDADQHGTSKATTHLLM